MRRRPPPRLTRLRAEGGQAAVEFVALLPLLVLLALAAWQAAVAGQAAWLAGGAARAGARAAAVGADPEAAARRTLPPALAPGLRVLARDHVEVRIAVPSVVGGGRVATVRARASFPRQEGS